MARKPAPESTYKTHSLDALLERKPELREPFNASVASLDKGEWEPLADFLIKAVPDAPELGKLAIDAQKQSAWCKGCSQTAAVVRRLHAGEPVPLAELCKTYDLAVFVLQMCHDSETQIPATKKELFVSWWTLIAAILGRALTPECERFNFDPAPLLTAGIDPSLSNSISANALVERIRLRADTLAQSNVAAAIESVGPANGAMEFKPPPAANGDYRPATWFPKGMAARLRMAAGRKRKTKRVKSLIVDGVVCYSVADARRWWPGEVPNETK